MIPHKLQQINSESDYTGKVCLLQTENGIGAYKDFNTMILVVGADYEGGVSSIEPDPDGGGIVLVGGAPFARYYSSVPVVVDIEDLQAQGDQQ